ncbi:MAG TPA: sensor domain-containing diguanylate cyclase [Vicinamibacterales bacterium]|nr:sensor domain-containing diguanylate cyclase [Vicinamibacterales bacterium]
MIPDCSAIASLVCGSLTEHVARETIARELSRALETRVCLFERSGNRWILRSPIDGDAPESQLGELLALRAAASSGRSAVELLRTGTDVWSAINVNVGELSAAILARGDWTTTSGALEVQATLFAYAWHSVREREKRREAENWLADEYRMTRRLTRLGSLESVCRRIVEQTSHSLRADRVTLAVYKPEEDRLVVTATQGDAGSKAQGARIEPGSWILGHVYSSGRSILVSDVRRIQDTASLRPSYKTFSFAAVPVRTGSQVIGVLSATDKSDGSPFDRRDANRLRSLSAPAALALVAARSDFRLRQLTHEARLDVVTGLFNRPYLEGRLREEIERARRTGGALTVLMADVDDFKAINDTHGHQTGDAVLHLIGRVLRSVVRVFDVCARYGGDEFVILMPGIDRASAAACGERIRQCASQSRMPASGRLVDRDHDLTLSIGIGCCRLSDTSADVIARADRCLYEAKLAGKNCVRMDGEPGTPS